MNELGVSLLGPVRAWRAGSELALGSAHRRAVLAVLASRANQVVTRSELIDAVWGEAAPASANGSIYTYVSALRGVLEPARPRRADWQVLVSAGSGYCLRLADGALDLERFDTLREQAKECQDTAGEQAALDAVLGLWQGDAFDGIPGPYAEAQRARLADLRLSTVERRAQLLINAGRQHGVVDELRELCDAHPLRGGLHGLLMHALYLTGRRAEAVAVFQRIRAATVDSLGTEPGPQLTSLFDEMLRDAPTLRRTRDDSARPIPLAAVTRPEAPHVLVGRDDEVATLRDAVAAVAAGAGGTLWLDGEPGIGKSAVLAAGLAETDGCQLAWHTAHEPTMASMASTPLHTMMDCLDVTTDSPDPCRAALAAAPTVDGMVDLVTKLCADGPLIVVLDQVQWADSLVWQRLADATTRLPLLLVAAGRTAPHTDTLTLGPLSDAAVRQLITGAAPGEALLDLALGAAGNPLFVKELVAGLDHGDFEPEARLPRAVVTAITRHVTDLSDAARGLLRWAALCGDVFTADDLAAVLPSPELSEVIAAGVLTECHGQLSFRHPLVRRALRDKHPTAVRAALHRQLAEALATEGAPVERVAEQLVLAHDVVDPWLCDWLATEVGTLAPRSPLTALRLLRRVLDSDWVSGERKETLAAVAARLMCWLDRAPRAEASYVAARTADLELAAEMRWLLAYLQFRRGDTAGAVEEVDQILRDEAVPESWRRRHDQLLAAFVPARVRAYAGGSRRPVIEETVSWARKAFRPLRAAATTTRSRPPNPEEAAYRAIGAYWQGRWDDALTAIAAPVSDGSALADYALGPPSSARVTHGVAALIAGHRGEVTEAQAHLAAAANTAGMDHEGVVLAATALLAEQRGDTGAACDILAAMIEPGAGAPGFHWLPWLVRLSMSLGHLNRAADATAWCARTAAQDPASAHCRALLDRDPELALRAADLYRRTCRRLPYAQAMADAAVLLAERGSPAEAAEAVRVPVRVYTELGAGWDIRRLP